MGQVKNWYEEVSYKDAKTFIQSNVQSMARSFIAVGFYLKQIRDRELYREDGYKSIWEFAQDTYGMSRSTAQRWMKMNDRFSQDGNSPILDERYKDFGKSQLQEMLYLTDEQASEVTPDMTVKEIRELKDPDPDPEPEPLSVLGYPRRVYPEGSLLTTQGCDKYDCFSCHRDGCAIRAEECYCVEAPLGNPFPCTTLNVAENLREEIGSICQFVNHDLAYTRAGDGEPVPCCRDCKNPCGYECRRSAEKRNAEKQKTEPEDPESSGIDILDFSVRTYNVLKKAGIDTVDQLKSMGRNKLVSLRGMSARSLTEIEKALGAYQETSQIDNCATSHTEDDQVSAQMRDEKHPVRDEAWFVKKFLGEEGKIYLPELMRMCRECKKSELAKSVQMLISPGGYRGASRDGIDYAFGSYSGGVSFREEIGDPYQRMTYARFVNEMLKLYDPWSQEWMPAEMEETEAPREPESVETVSGDVVSGDVVSCGAEGTEPEEPETAADEPRFTVLFIKDILQDKETELEQMEECNAQPDGNLPVRMMQEHRAVVAGLRLLLELAEMREREELGYEEN